MKILRTIRNYFFYCGIEKKDYNELKRDAYISNFKVWRVLHFLMVAVFGVLFVSSLISDMMGMNRVFYLVALVYSVLAVVLFFLLKKDSLIAQFMIYLSISMLYLFGCFITTNKPDTPAVTFIVFLLIAPMFMIDKPYFMAIELCMADIVFLSWMHAIKPYNVWKIDLVNVITYTIVGVFLNIISNSIRIKEFVLTRKIKIQKDTDELTGLKNKSALTREINKYLSDQTKDKGILYIFDVDKFKSINDTYGHDVGDTVISQIGSFLASRFTHDEIVGRFGGDEFIVFIKDENDPVPAKGIAESIVKGVAENVYKPNEQVVSVSVGVALYSGRENDYSKLFKKAETAMYKAKADPNNRFAIYEE